MKMDNRSGARAARLVERRMQWHLLRRLVPVHEPPLRVEPRQAGGVERAKGRSCRRDKQPTVAEAGGDIPRTSGREAAGEHGCSDAAYLLSKPCFIAHRAMSPASTPAAFSKNPTEPKLPDFRASTISRSLAFSAGTPGSISGPISKDEMLSADTTAPDVSPPATTNRRRPRAES